MKSLSLYIDKWYIIGAVTIDDIPRPVRLPNREDRIWLYFHEDEANNEISYSKGFQRKYRDKENHYYGDVFSLITKSSAKYRMFKRFEDMKGIFKSAKIFEDLRADVEENGDIETFVSFSKDIGLAARKIFLDAISAEKFEVKENVARIDHLALEYAVKKSGLAKDGYYLVLNACNENLHYSLYRKSKRLFVREQEDVLEGLGTDVRNRSLIEHVVDSINNREHLLQTKAERESEYLRMTQFVDDWIIKLSTARSFMPIQIPGITFSNDPHREYSVSVQKNKIDLRTEKIVQDIVHVIVGFVKDSNVSHEEIKGILFLGNTFTNVQFRAEFHKYYNLSNDDMIGYKDAELPSLVSAYNFIDLEQFSTITSKLMGDAEAELQRIKLAEEEAERQRKAQEEADAIAEIKRKEVDAERNFKEAMEKGYERESNRDYDGMADYFGIAKNLCPDSEEAKEKYNEALRKKAEKEVRLNNYKEKIQQAKKACEDNDWETARQKADEALSYMEESKEAERIKEEAVRYIKHAKDLERYLDRTDLFIAQKAYNEALQELGKAKLLEVSKDGQEEIKRRELKITKEQKATEQSIKELSEKMEKAIAGKLFEEAMAFCSQLVEIDFANSRKWSVRIADIRAQQEEARKADENFRRIQTEIESAQWTEDWTRLVNLCRLALEIKEDAPTRTKLERAEKKVEEQKALKQLDEAIDEIKDMILNSDFNEARRKLNQIKKMSLDVAREAKVKELNRLIFYKEEETENARREKKRQANHTDFNEQQDTSRTVVAGFSSASQKGFFEEDTSSPSKQKDARKATITRPTKPSKANDSFFDCDFGGVGKASAKHTDNHIDKITNDDFNF